MLLSLLKSGTSKSAIYSSLATYVAEHRRLPSTIQSKSPPHAAAHTNPNGPGDSRPTALKIVEDEGVRQTKGKIIVIIGTSSGIGIETVRALGYRCHALPDGEKCRHAKRALADILDPGRVWRYSKWIKNPLHLHRAAAKAIPAKIDRVNILINNAGTRPCRPSIHQGRI